MVKAIQETLHLLYNPSSAHELLQPIDISYSMFLLDILPISTYYICSCQISIVPISTALQGVLFDLHDLVLCKVA